MTLWRRIGGWEAARPEVEGPCVIFLAVGKGEVSHAFRIGRDNISCEAGETEAAFIERAEQCRQRRA
jgi:hypothetical protein